MSAFATAAAAGAPPSVFLGFWDQGGDANHVNRSVSVQLKQGVDSAFVQPTKATIYLIDDSSVNPYSTWVAMGSPDVPSPAQLQQLIGASEVKGERIAVSAGKATVMMQPNSAVLVAFEA